MKNPGSGFAEALRIQRAAARLGFDWRHEAELWDKLQEEIGEMRRVSRRKKLAQEELGDLLFMAVNLARHLGLDAEQALRQANRKFSRRFAYVMGHAERLPAPGHPERLLKMEALWQEAKLLERRPNKKKR